MQIKQGMIVRSTSGHDSDSFYVVVKIENGFCFIADGRRRKLEKPKCKNILHLAKTQKLVDLSLVDTNKKIRRVLHSLNNDVCSVAE